MELFFMLTATLALLGPIVAGRLRFILLTQRARKLFNRILPPPSQDQHSLHAGAFAWPHDTLSGKPDWCPKQAWTSRTSAIRSERSTTLSNFVRATAALARVDQIAPNYARRPHYS